MSHREVIQALKHTAQLCRDRATTDKILALCQTLEREALAEQPEHALIRRMQGQIERLQAALDTLPDRGRSAMAAAKSQPAQQPAKDEYGEALLSAWDAVRDPGPAGDDVPHPVFSAGFAAGWNARSEPTQQPLTDEQAYKSIKDCNELRKANKELLDLLGEVSSNFTRDDDLPDELLPRIDAAIAKHGGST